jgi:hypothetical protein
MRSKRTCRSADPFPAAARSLLGMSGCPSSRVARMRHSSVFITFLVMPSRMVAIGGSDYKVLKPLANNLRTPRQSWRPRMPQSQLRCCLHFICSCRKQPARSPPVTRAVFRRLAALYHVTPSVRVPQNRSACAGLNHAKLCNFKFSSSERVLAAQIFLR